MLPVYIFYCRLFVSYWHTTRSPFLYILKHTRWQQYSCMSQNKKKNKEKFFHESHTAKNKKSRCIIIVLVLVEYSNLQKRYIFQITSNYTILPTSIWWRKCKLHRLLPNFSQIQKRLYESLVCLCVIVILQVLKVDHTFVLKYFFTQDKY